MTKNGYHVKLFSYKITPRCLVHGKKQKLENLTQILFKEGQLLYECITKINGRKETEIDRE